MKPSDTHDKSGGKSGSTSVNKSLVTRMRSAASRGAVKRAAKTRRVAGGASREPERSRPSGRATLNIEQPRPKHCVAADDVRHATNQFREIQGEYFYSAYVDRRNASVTFVRVMALLRRQTLSDLHCHFRNASDDIVTSPGELYEMCENHRKLMGGWMVSCELPEVLRDHTPCSVMVSTLPTFSQRTPPQLYVELPLFDTRSAHSASAVQSFGVCVPPLFGNITPSQLVEFVEMTRLLGARHFVFYNHSSPRFALSSELSLALRFYQHLGVATTIPWRLPTSDRDVWYKGQLLAINDCLYRTMHALRFVAFNDLDEFIVPRVGARWQHIVREVEEYVREQTRFDRSIAQMRVVAYSFPSAFFVSDEHPPPASQLAVHRRTRTQSDVRKKVMVRPEAIFELGIHHVSRVFDDSSAYVHNVWKEQALLHHYRACTAQFDPAMQCYSFVHDNTTAKYLTALRLNVDKVTSVLNEIHSLHADDVQKYWHKQQTGANSSFHGNASVAKTFCSW